MREAWPRIRCVTRILRVFVPLLHVCPTCEMLCRVWVIIHGILERMRKVWHETRLLCVSCACAICHHTNLKHSTNTERKQNHMPETQNLKPVLNNPYPEPLNLKAKSSTLSPRPSAPNPKLPRALASVRGGRMRHGCLEPRLQKPILNPKNKTATLSAKAGTLNPQPSN